MIVPIISSITREVLTAVPQSQREAVLALGATRWEMMRMARAAQRAHRASSAAVILGLGRALGETMAVTMVIGNRPEISQSLFAPGYTMASVIANEFSRGHRRPLPERAGRNRPGAVDRDRDRECLARLLVWTHHPRAVCEGQCLARRSRSATQPLDAASPTWASPRRRGWLPFWCWCRWWPSSSTC